jgi:hypothetical protein
MTISRNQPLTTDDIARLPLPASHENGAMEER